jgi:hypothetical protein
MTILRCPSSPLVGVPYNQPFVQRSSLNTYHKSTPLVNYLYSQSSTSPPTSPPSPPPVPPPATSLHLKRPSCPLTFPPPRLPNAINFPSSCSPPGVTAHPHPLEPAVFLLRQKPLLPDLQTGIRGGEGGGCDSGGRGVVHGA